MGMPGSSEWLDEMMSRVVGEMVMAGSVTKIADDLYVGGATVQELMNHWECLLALLQKNNLKLSASKTVICPKSTTILGWIWSNGTLCASSHKISPLLACDPPKTCTAMRSFLGAFKDVSRSIPRCSSLLSPLENAIKGMAKETKITWTTELLDFFTKAKQALESPRSLVLPQKVDKLLITVDASPLNQGLAGTLFVVRDGKRLVSDNFSFKLKDHHVGWLPCEKEALAITAAVSHFSPYIKESDHTTQVLTDSKPCTQAWDKLRKGLFSASARVSTFLSTLASSNVSLCHIKGSLNKISDYGSRNPSECDDMSCQICKFVQDTASSVVFAISVTDILQGTARMPYLSSNSWKSAQQNDPCLRKAYAHLVAGTRPPPKTRNAKELRDVIRIASVDSQRGILVVRKEDPFVGSRDLIWCPSSIASGLITALHICLSHPSKTQLTKVFGRHFYAFGSTKIINEVSDNCDSCRALKKAPKEIFEQSSSSPPSHPGSSLAADVICRSGQKILVARDTLTSYTTATFIQGETVSEYRDGLIICTLPMKSQLSSVRVDCAPGLKPLKNDKTLHFHGIFLDYGRTKNPNKNPVAERANQELELEIIKIDPSGKPITAATLTRAVDILNTRIRKSGLSSKEMFFCRDQVSGKQLTFDDTQLGLLQSDSRSKNHISSAKCKGKGGNVASSSDISVGSIVYIKQEGSKFRARESYIVLEISDAGMASLQKMDTKKGLFSSLKYDVPVINLYPAVVGQKSLNIPPTSYFGKPDSEDGNQSDPEQLWDTSSSLSEDSLNEVALPSSSHTEDLNLVDQATHSSVDSDVAPRRSSRSRQRPDRLNSVQYDSEVPLQGESDTTENWWPNYPRGTWAPDT